MFNRTLPCAVLNDRRLVKQDDRELRGLFGLPFANCVSSLQEIGYAWIADISIRAIF